jgi:hypothetical protein
MGNGVISLRKGSNIRLAQERGAAREERGAAREERATTDLEEPQQGPVGDSRGLSLDPGLNRHKHVVCFGGASKRQQSLACAYVRRKVPLVQGGGSFAVDRRLGIPT